MSVPGLYPTLPGLTFSVIKRPIFFGATATSASGREVRVSYAQNPLWEWDLTYEYLPDQSTDSSFSSSDLRLLLGFYLAQTGSLQGFRFRDVDDFQVTDQLIAVGDGVTTDFILQRTLGGGSGGGSEPIGWLDQGLSFSAAIDGVPETSYALVQNTPVRQLISFTTPPAFGALITVSMSYFYFVRFKDDSLDFEKFMDKLWSQRLITLRSLRIGTFIPSLS